MPTKSRLGAIALILLAASCSVAENSEAATKFNRQFAPQDGLLAPVEKPYRDEICLNGSWQFQPVALPEGFQQGKSPVPNLSAPVENNWDKTPIRIPSPWNVNAFPDQKGVGGDFRCYPSYPDSWKNVQMGWLRRSFTVPNSWRGRRLLLHFDAVAGSTQVLVNGKPVGGHDDIFLPFELDVTDAIQFDAENSLLVGVRKSSLRDVQGKYGRRPYQGGSFWGQAIAGIWQDVFLSAVPVARITDVFVQPQVDQDTLRAEVTVRNDSNQAVNLNLSGAAYSWNSQAGKDTLTAPEPKWSLGKTSALDLAAVPVTVPAYGQTKVTISAQNGGKLKLWSPDGPNLYGLVCRLQNGTTPADTKYTRFGWRQIGLNGNQVLLNGKPIVLKGDSWHFMGIPQMSRRYAWAWYKALKDANLNAVRLHAQPYPSFYLDVADEQGILVLDESAIWASDGGPKIDDPAFWQDSEKHIEKLVLRDRNHPSVMGWSISNELMAIVRGVFRGTKEQQDETVRYFGIWADICRRLDPTRTWISADGEDDGHGTLPTYVVHYGGTGTMERGSKSGKPWGVGEAGPAYYGTPEQIAQQSGNQRAYLSFDDRMEGVAAVSYQSLMDQRKYNAVFRSVFNLAWYGLRPLELGMTDTTQAPALTDGVFFPPFVENKPGVQPERLGPYSTTLNPGYDTRLPLYQTWPLFDAIRAAQAEPAQSYKPAREFAFQSGKPLAASTIKSVRVFSGNGGTLATALSDLGVPVASGTDGDETLVIIDGAQPPAADAKASIQGALEAGGTVLVWGANAASLSQLNALLPAPLELTARTASSLVPAENQPLLSGITPASLYFSELSPSTILPAGLGGPLLTNAKILLTASNTEWLRWNRRGEANKTAMIVRSERESKPSGVALAEVPAGRGRILVCNIPAVAQTSQAVSLNRILLGNLGVALGDSISQRNILDADGSVTRVLAAGLYSFSSLEEGVAASIVPPNSGGAIVAGAVVKDRTWIPVARDVPEGLNLKSLRGVNAQQAGAAYLSFWLFSPKALDNLLLDPHLPTLDLTTQGVGAVQVWFNGKSVAVASQDGTAVAANLPAQQGWNHVLVKMISAPGSADFSPTLKLRSSQAEYLTQIRGTQEKP